MKSVFVLLLAFSAVALTTQQIVGKPARPITKPPPITTTKALPKNKFSVIAPNTIRPNKDFIVYVRALDVTSAVDISIVLASDDGSFKVEKPVRLSRSTTKYVGKFDTSSLPDAASSFTLTVSSGDYTQSKSVAYVKKLNSIFIQTSKGIFKPSEVAQFRVFSIDSESNAFDPKKLYTITLTDPRNNEIGKIEGPEFVNGKFQGEWQLPSKPIFGTWRITVTNSENDEPVVKTFVVNEYTLSLFTASLSVPSQVSYASTQFPITINAEYTFKQPISGIATITITKDNGETWVKNVSCTDKTTTFFVNIVKDLGYTTSDYRSLTVNLVFIDPKTNTKVTDVEQVSVVPFTYFVEFINDKIFKLGDSLQYTVVTKTLDGKPAPKIVVTVKINNKVIATLTTGSDGTAKGTYKAVLSEYLGFEGSCKACSTGYSYANPIGLNRPSQGISLELITENPSFQNPLELIATVAEDVDFFFYFAVSKGVLVEYGRIYLDEDGDPDNDPRTVEFTIQPDFTYAPTLKIYAYYYRKSDAQFLHTTTYVQFKEELPNYLTLKLKGRDKTGNSVVKPGENITLTIQSKAYSIVSLAAIDQRVLQLANNQNFTLSQVIESLNSYDGNFFGIGKRGGFFFYDYYGARQAGLNFFTNIPEPVYDYPIPRERPGAEPREKSAAPSRGGAAIKVRKDFREVFLFEDVAIETDEYNEEEGYSVIKRKVTDQITTYLLFGVSMNKNSGMGLPATLPSATIYLPFFISLEFPSSVKRGETLTLDIQVFNYLTTSQSVNLTVANDVNFDVISGSSNGWTVSNGLLVQIIRVSSNQVFTAKLQIRPKVVGVINLKVTAKGSSAGDAIEKPLRVIPEGVLRSITTSTLIAVDSNNTVANQTLTCTLPASAFNDTADISATVIGDILGKALTNLDKLIMMPGGCGEQTMIGLVPDIAIYSYLEVTGQLTATLKAKLTQYITAGYQNELQYQRTDGGFSAFGNNDPNSSSWLTAYVAMSFNWASKYVSGISPSIIQSAIDFIISQQNTDGSFNEPGRVIHSDMQGAAGNGIGLTAYITIALSELAVNFPSVVPARNLAVQYLEQQLNSITDAYQLAVIAYALTLSSSSNATTAYNKFYVLRTETPTEIFWSVPAPPSQNVYYGARSLDIEVTSYGLLLLVKRNAGLINSLKVVKNLMSKSNSFGGYSSSQDTVMALLALSSFASTYTLSQANVNLLLTPNFGTAINAQINQNNSLTLQTFALNSRTRSLGVNVKSGSNGVAIVSLTCNFYEDPTKSVPSFNISFSFANSCQWRIQMQVCVKPKSGTSSNMAIMEVKLPSGYYYYEAWWVNNENNGISKTETYEDSTVVVFYFNSIQANGTCVTFAAGQTAVVADLKPGSIVINDYYDTSKQGSASFSIPSNVRSAPCNSFFF